MKTFVLSLLVCSPEHDRYRPAVPPGLPGAGQRYAARWRYAAWLVVLAGFLLPIR